MPYILNSGSTAIRADTEKGPGRGDLTIYAAWDNNTIPNLTPAQVLKFGARVTFVKDLPPAEVSVDPAVVEGVLKMNGSDAAAFVATVKSTDTLDLIAAADERSSTKRAVTKRKKELDG